jgi:hypothetical protein
MKYLIYEGKYVIADPNCTYVIDMQIPPPFVQSFQLIMDGSQYVMTSVDSSVPYTGDFSFADASWQGTSAGFLNVSTYDGKIFIPISDSLFTVSTYNGTLIVDAENNYYSELLRSGHKTINGDYFPTFAYANGGIAPITPEGVYIHSGGPGGGVQVVWRYDISTNTGYNLSQFSSFSGYQFSGFGSAGVNQVNIGNVHYSQDDNAFYARTNFIGLGQYAFLVFKYDANTMYKFDYDGFRDSSTSTPVQINGIPMPDIAGGISLNNFCTNRGNLFIRETDSSIWVYDIESSTGYYMTSSGLYDGTSTTLYSTGSLVPEFQNIINIIPIENYVYIGGQNVIYKYDIDNNRILQKINRDPAYIVDDTSTLHNFSSSLINFDDFWVDEINNILFIKTGVSIYSCNLDNYQVTPVNDSNITNGLSISAISSATFSRIAGDAENRRVVFIASSADLNIKGIYEILY